jgi:uncharacterized protein with PhoU and TrkA domain
MFAPGPPEGAMMDRVEALREQARQLRELAARSSADPEIVSRMHALARQCDELAESLGDTVKRR